MWGWSVLDRSMHVKAKTSLGYRGKFVLPQVVVGHESGLVQHLSIAVQRLA
jgi:hypothetical protein